MELGHVTLPSGTLVVVDTGLLGLWKHDRAPLMDEWEAEPSVVELANSAVDLRISGRDAERAVQAFDRSHGGLHIYDIPVVYLPKLRAMFSACMGKHGLTAHLEPLEARVTHRERVALACTRGGGTLSFHGVWAVALDGLPADRPLPVTAERLDDGSWRMVRLEVAPGAVATTAHLGDLMVDKSRAMFFDADAIGAWLHEEPLDGRGDFVFWGRDAVRLAKVLGAPPLGDEHFGWKDLLVEEAAARARRADDEKERLGLMLAADFRPHSHHYEVMDQIRTTPTDSAELEVGGARLVAFQTFGDGCFPVVRELDAAGRLVGVRIELAAAPE